MPKHLYRCTRPGEIASPSYSTTPQTSYPARFAEEETQGEELNFLEADVGVNYQQLRLPINPNYELGAKWLVRLSGETAWSKITHVRKVFVEDRPRFWILTRERKE